MGVPYLSGPSHSEWASPFALDLPAPSEWVSHTSAPTPESVQFRPSSASALSWCPRSYLCPHTQNSKFALGEMGPQLFPTLNFRP